MTVNMNPIQPIPHDSPSTKFRPSDITDHGPPSIEKSNVLLLGPSGVGKTLMVKTLARVLDVPFSISNCTSFTQAGYIGEDAETCVARLLAAADYDVEAAERGIIILDEIDKIATAKMSHGKDVGGEGVQQALLGIIEGTTVQIQAKPERGAGKGPGSGYPPGSPQDGSRPGAGAGIPPPGGKGEVYNVRTDNILFICAGAFVNLHKVILERISKGSIGFGASVRSSNPDPGTHETMLKGEDALFKKHLPFYIPPDTEDTRLSQSAQQSATSAAKNMYNMLDLVEPTDLQKYGMIPELIGRIPTLCAVSALDEDALVRVLTEPRNSLIRQYEQLFRNSGIELRFTNYALREMAKRASGMGTGARGLRTVLERMLEETMFEAPGGSFKADEPF
jgi:ATP-dependent Clp protease ATP-binding subunit ClpX